MRSYLERELEDLLFFQPLGDAEGARQQVRESLHILRSLRVTNSEETDLSKRLVNTIAALEGLAAVTVILKSLQGKTIVESLVPLLRGTIAEGAILTRPDLAYLTGQS